MKLRTILAIVGLMLALALPGFATSVASIKRTYSFQLLGRGAISTVITVAQVSRETAAGTTLAAHRPATARRSLWAASIPRAWRRFSRC
jgi:type II secretory pathway pseudopilin PulG